MPYPFSDDHDMIAETVRAAAQDIYAGGKGPEAIAESGVPHDAKAWSLLAGELGLAGIAIPEMQGGADMGDLGIVAVMEALGGGLTSVPFLTTIGIVSGLLSRFGSESAKAEWLPKIAAGQIRVTYCDGHDALTDQGGLSGRVSNVVDLGCATHLLTTVRDGDQLALVMVTLRAAMKTVRETMDPTRGFGDLILDATPYDRCGTLSPDQHATEIIRSFIGLSAENVGIAQTCLDLTVEYAGQRVQFDRPIASFQAVKHRCADMFIKLEEARAAVLAAAVAPEDQKVEACRIAKAVSAENAFWIAGSAIQMHGGIGFTWDYPLHYFFKRARANRAMFGSAQSDWDHLAEHVFGTAA